MPSNNLILFIIRRGKKLLLVKQSGKKALWSLPGGRSALKDGFTRAAYRFLRPYFRDLHVTKVKYLHAPIEDIRFADTYQRVIPIECLMRGTIKKDMKRHVWFAEIERLMHHIVISGTIELLQLPEIRNRLV